MLPPSTAAFRRRWKSKTEGHFFQLASRLLGDNARAEGRQPRGDLPGKVLDDPAGLPPLAARPLDQDVLEMNLSLLTTTIFPHTIGPRGSSVTS